MVDIDPRQTEPAALLAAAAQVRLRAHAPYSNFRVGAALLARDGSVHTGCNVENASYGLTLCAERTALARAVAEGVTQFVALAVRTNGSRPVSPCGACRQVLAEFGLDLVVWSQGETGPVARWSLGELLPHGMGRVDLLDAAGPTQSPAPLD